MIIDVSKWQGKINWNSVKEAGVTSVYIKASEGVGYVDPNLLINATKAHETDIKVGYYHYASLNDHNETIDAVKEAKFFISVIKKLPLDLPLVLDIEKNTLRLSKDEVLNWINSFFMELKKNGFTNYWLYSYAPFLNENLPINHGLGNIPLWLAAYTTTPKLPKGWDKFVLWQYTQQGKVNGINGNVDLNK